MYIYIYLLICLFIYYTYPFTNLPISRVDYRWFMCWDCWWRATLPRAAEGYFPKGIVMSEFRCCFGLQGGSSFPGLGGMHTYVYIYIDMCIYQYMYIHMYLHIHILRTYTYGPLVYPSSVGALGPAGHRSTEEGLQKRGGWFQGRSLGAWSGWRLRRLAWRVEMISLFLLLYLCL